MTAEDALARAEQLLVKVEEVRAKLEVTDDPETALGLLEELSALAKDVQAEIERAKQESDARA